VPVTFFRREYLGRFIKEWRKEVTGTNLSLELDEFMPSALIAGQILWPCGQCRDRKS
jgi:hypothetical protein